MRRSAVIAVLVAVFILMFAFPGLERALAAGPGMSTGRNALPVRRSLVATFKPMDFRVKHPERSYTQNNTMLYANFRGGTSDGGVTFTARLRLPVGARIAALTLTYSTLGTPNPLFNGELLRLTPGGGPVQILGIGGSSVTGGAVTQTTSSTLISSDPRDLIINAASEYAVEVYSHNVSTRIHGLKVAYTAP